MRLWDFRKSHSPKVSTRFFIHSMLKLRYHTLLQPRIIPAKNCATRYALCISLIQQKLRFKLRGQLLEEDSSLIDGTEGRDEFLLIALDQLIGRSHMEEEHIADQFRNRVILIGTNYW